jgi:hypothetical protein
MRALGLLMLLLTHAEGAWTPLAPGVEHAQLLMDPHSKVTGFIQVVRMTPGKATLRTGLASREGGKRTAAQWCKDLGAVAVINAGMFQEDNIRNVGRLVDGGHVNQAHWTAYRSALVWSPLVSGLPWARMLDLEAPGAREEAGAYSAVVQNLRLIKAPGRSVWKANGKSWSEASVAQDAQGRILFLFTRDAYEMETWNRLVLALPLHVVQAMHVEGGPEASLSLCRTTPPQHFSGSFETGFNPNDDLHAQWPLPNVLAMMAGPP